MSENKISLPLVSVIMPAYNAEKYIGQAVESIINQTYSNWELIIVDDKSIDNTLNIIKEYKDERIKVYMNDVNKGIAFTTNRGIENSNGKYIALLDDDDIAEYNRLELQVQYLEQHEEIDILGGRTVLIDSDGEYVKFLNTPRNNPKYIKAVLLFNCMDFLNSTAMIRKGFIELYNLCYRENCYGMQDFKFYIDSSKVGNISTIDRLLLRHRIHEKNETTRNMTVYAKERVEKYAEFQRDSLKESGFNIGQAVVGLFFTVLIVFLQDDFSTAFFIMLVGLLMFFVAGIKLGWFLGFCVFSLPIIVLFICTESYRVKRLIAFFNPEQYSHGVNYQINASRRAISSGGFLGEGFGSGLKRVSGIPEVQADFIFAGWSEAMGFLGVILFFVLIIYFAWRGYKIAFKCEDRFRSYVAFGIVTSIVLQTLLNCGVVCGALPATGIPLPFFSSGGSSLIITLLMCGVVINISKFDNNNLELYNE